jgi:hypothetical protein
VPLLLLLIQLLLVVLLQLLLLLLMMLLAPLLLLLLLRQVVVQWGLEAPVLGLEAGPSAALPTVPTVMDDPPEPHMAPSEGEIVVQRSVDEIVLVQSENVEVGRVATGPLQVFGNGWASLAPHTAPHYFTRHVWRSVAPFGTTSLHDHPTVAISPGAFLHPIEGRLRRL